MYISNARPNQPLYEKVKRRVVNRGGATALVVGDVMAFDTDASQAETQALAGVGGTVGTLIEAMYANIVNVGVAPANAEICVVTDLLANENSPGTAGADNTVVEVQVVGEVKAKIGGTDWSTAFSSAGVGLMADTTGANRRLVAAVDGANRGKVGFIAENVATNLAAANAVHTVNLIGFGSSVGTVGA